MPKKKAPKQSDRQLPQFFKKHTCEQCNKSYMGHMISVYFHSDNKHKRILKRYICPRCISDMDDVRSVLFWI